MISLDRAPVRIVTRSELPEGCDAAVDVSGITCTYWAFEAMRRAVLDHNAREEKAGHALPFVGFRKACPTLRFAPPTGSLS